jgi:hypothetical protein
VQITQTSSNIRKNLIVGENLSPAPSNGRMGVPLLLGLISQQEMVK